MNHRSAWLVFACLVVLTSVGGVKFIESIHQQQAAEYAQHKQQAKAARGVVVLETTQHNRLTGKASAVMIGDQWAVTAKHVLTSGRPSVVLAHGQRITVTAIYHPDQTLRGDADDWPVLLQLAETIPTSFPQPIADLGAYTTEAQFVGMNRREVAKLPLVWPLRTIAAFKHYGIWSTTAAYIPHDNRADSFCRGDSGGGLFNTDGQVFALLSGWMQGTVSHAAEFKVASLSIHCASGIGEFIYLPPYQAWIESVINP